MIGKIKDIYNICKYNNKFKRKNKNKNKKNLNWPKLLLFIIKTSKK